MKFESNQYTHLSPILEMAEKWNKKDKVCVIAIDGRAAAGKTTMAEQLKDILHGDVIHMDDFFLPVELRTKERFETPGGNIHYERFIEEVLPYISNPKSFSYRRFDCGKMDYSDECTVKNTHFRIVEGSYSCHPLFGNYADISVFVDVESNEQMKRIRCRNSNDIAERYRDIWIPLEEKYFEEYEIDNNVLIKIIPSHRCKIKDKVIY